MQITDVRVRKTTSEGKVKANCSVVFDSMFVVHDLRVVEGARGIFVAMPRRKTAEGEFKDLAHPITAEARESIAKVVLNAFYHGERPQNNEAEQMQSNEAEQMQSNEAEQMQGNEAEQMQGNEAEQTQSHEAEQLESDEAEQLESNIA